MTMANLFSAEVTLQRKNRVSFVRFCNFLEIVRDIEITSMTITFQESDYELSSDINLAPPIPVIFGVRTMKMAKIRFSNF